jgi:hypothetical protein
MGTRIQIIGILLGCIVLSLNGCKKAEDRNCFKSIGRQVHVERPVPHFTGIEVYNRIEYVLVNDTVEKIVIDCGENLVNFIETRIEAGRLVIENNNICNFLRSYEHTIRIEIHYKAINHIIYNGAGKFSCADTIRCYELKTDSWNGSGDYHLLVNCFLLETYFHSGSADAYVSGWANINYAYSNASGFFRQQELRCKSNLINHSGTGTFYMGPSEYMEIQIHNLGDIIYTGNPVILYTTNDGKGQLLKE